MTTPRNLTLIATRDENLRLLEDEAAPDAAGVAVIDLGRAPQGGSWLLQAVTLQVAKTDPTDLTPPAGSYTITVYRNAVAPRNIIDQVGAPTVVAAGEYNPPRLIPSGVALVIGYQGLATDGSVVAVASVQVLEIR